MLLLTAINRTFFRKEHFRIDTDLKEVSYKPAHVLHNDGSGLTGFHFVKQGIEARTVEIRSRISIVGEVTDMGETVLLRVF
jgi:hypothetical protein